MGHSELLFATILKNIPEAITNTVGTGVAHVVMPRIKVANDQVAFEVAESDSMLLEYRAHYGDNRVKVHYEAQKAFNEGNHWVQIAVQRIGRYRHGNSTTI
jgi:hypothetical protein